MGNSGILINASHGQAIDAHEAVWRLNLAPIHGHEPDVGTRTTVQLMNPILFRNCNRTPKSDIIIPVHCDAGDARAVCKCVPNGDQAAVVIKRDRGAIDPEKIRIAEQRHPQTAFIQLSKMHPPLCNAVARAYAELRLEARGDEAGKELHWHSDKAIATTGLAAVLAALALCDKVS